MGNWLATLKIGDALSIAMGCVLLVGSLLVAEDRGPPASVVIRAADEEYVYPLDQSIRVDVAGALGTTVVEIDQGRVRVAQDPGPQQICVKDGWIERTGQWLMCLPNKVMVTIVGRSEVTVDGASY